MKVKLVCVFILLLICMFVNAEPKFSNWVEKDNTNQVWLVTTYWGEQLGATNNLLIMMREDYWIPPNKPKFLNFFKKYERDVNHKNTNKLDATALNGFLDDISQDPRVKIEFVHNDINFVPIITNYGIITVDMVNTNILIP